MPGSAESPAPPTPERAPAPARVLARSRMPRYLQVRRKWRRRRHSRLGGRIEDAEGDACTPCPSPTPLRPRAPAPPSAGLIRCEALAPRLSSRPSPPPARVTGSVGSIAPTTGASACSVCPRGKTTTALGATVCKDCTGNASSAAGLCYCLPGFTGAADEGGLCTACPQGQFKASNGSAACDLCPANTFSAAKGAISESVCSTCPANSTSAAGAGACLCSPGFTRDGASAPCQQCAAGTFKSAPGDSQCEACAAGFVRRPASHAAS